MSRQSLLSRSAEAIFWMARYVERAENIARILDVNLNLQLDSGQSPVDQWRPMFEVSGDEEEFDARYPSPTAGSVMRFMTFDSTYRNSIANCLYVARENGRTVREIISSEMWEQLNRYYLFVKSANPDKVLKNPSDFYREIRRASHLFEGLSWSTMSHSEAWNFATLGRMIERADQTSRILDVKYFVLLPKAEDVGTPVDDIQWAAVLKSVSGFEMYRKLYGALAPATIVEFLIMNGEFPRSIVHCLKAAREALYTITSTSPDTYRLGSERLLSKLSSDLRYADTREIVISGLHEYLDRLQVRFNEVGEAIHEDFFAPAELRGGPA